MHPASLTSTGPVDRPVALPGERPRIAALDGLRGIAIGLVLVHHFFHGFEPASGLVDRVTFAAASRGWMGVDLFFVLSGYLITGILLEARGRPRYFLNFYARRTLRIFPLYYTVLAAVFLVGPAFSEWCNGYVHETRADQVWHWTYLTNWRLAWRGEWYPQLFPNVLWSLAIEEQFYLVWPAVVALAGPRRLVTIALSLVIVAPLIRIGLAFYPETNWIAGFTATPARADALALGALAAIYARRPEGLARYRRAAWSAALIGLALYGFLTVQQDKGWEDEPLQALRFSAVALLFVGVLVLSEVARDTTEAAGAATTSSAGLRQLLSKCLQARPLLVLGKYSYALYLLHGPVDAFVKSHWSGALAATRGGSALPSMALYMAIAGGLSLALAWVSWRVLEQPCLRLKRHFAA